jgi:hypothetical protein
MYFGIDLARNRTGFLVAFAVIGDNVDGLSA